MTLCRMCKNWEHVVGQTLRRFPCYQDLPGSILLSSGISSTGISLIAAWISQIFGWKMEGCEDRGEPRHGVPKCSWPSTAWRFGVAWWNASKNNTFRGWGVEGVEVSCTFLPHILSSGWLGVNSVCFTSSSVIIYIYYIYTYCATYMDISGLLTV